MENKFKKITERRMGSDKYSNEYVNISKSERVVSSAFGVFMLWKGVKDIFTTPSNALWEVILGGGLLYRGVTGYCAVKDRLVNCDSENGPEVMEREYVVESR